MPEDQEEIDDIPEDHGETGEDLEVDQKEEGKEGDEEYRAASAFQRSLKDMADKLSDNEEEEDLIGGDEEEEKVEGEDVKPEEEEKPKGEEEMHEEEKEKHEEEEEKHEDGPVTPSAACHLH